jgi:hypothetical protein
MTDAPIDRLDLADRLNELARRCRMLGHAIRGLEGDDDPSAEEDTAYEIETALREISEQLAPDPEEKEREEPAAKQ